jgi:hypothetical protein
MVYLEDNQYIPTEDDPTEGQQVYVQLPETWLQYVVGLFALLELPEMYRAYDQETLGRMLGWTLHVENLLCRTIKVEHMIVAPVGTIVMYAAAGDIPENWLECNGTTYDVDVYPDLYNAIGFDYGSDGGNFRVPDFRARSPMGAGQKAGFTSRPLASQAGEENTTLTVGQIPEHTHLHFAATVNFDYAEGGESGQEGYNLEATDVNSPSGGSHNTVHPILAVRFMIRAK